MFEIAIKKGGTDKTFSKEYVNIEDNLLAIEHQVRQTAHYTNDKSSLDPLKTRKLNESYLKMFVDMYGGQFTVDDLKQANMSAMRTLNALFIEALGGEKDNEDGAEKKEA